MHAVSDMVCSLGPYADRVEETLGAWDETGRIRRIWNRDSTLWSGADEDRWLGWLRPADQEEQALASTFQEIKARGFRDVLLLGMGGSSRCAEVLSLTFGGSEGFPKLHVLDSTVPSQVARAKSKLSPEHTLYIVASKSGTTTEANVLCDTFLEETKKVVGKNAGGHFAAITDPGTPLEAFARQAGFAYVFHGDPEIGGRYSALSNFGRVPSEVIGLDFAGLLRSAADMAARCGPGVPCEENPGAVLGIILAELALQGRDKVTLVITPEIQIFGTWLEQLLAESTGKEGRGLIPVENEPLGPPEVYDDDRFFVYIRRASEPESEQDEAMEAVRASGHPIVRIELEDQLSLGAEFFRWEMATAVAGAVLGVNPFDQPNVQESKALTTELIESHDAGGELPADRPLLSEAGIQVFADDRNAEALSETSFPECIRRHLNRLGKGDYLALCAYLDPVPTTLEVLQAIRLAIRDRTGVATTLGFGPRYLHSTGQLHKRGPESGLFVMIGAEDPNELEISGRRLTFGVLNMAQALGDFGALSRRKRRLVRLYISGELKAGLERLQECIVEALS